MAQQPSHADLEQEAGNLHDALDHLGSDVTQSALNTASSVAAAATALQELLLALPEQLASGDLQQKAASTSALLRAVMESMQQQWVGVPWHTKLAAYAASTLGLLLLVRQQQQKQQEDTPPVAAAAAAGGGGGGSSATWPTPAGKAALAAARGDEAWMEAELAPGDRAAAAGGAGGSSSSYKKGETFLRAMPANSWGMGGSSNPSSSRSAGGPAVRKVPASADAAGEAGAVAPSEAADAANSSRAQKNNKYGVAMRTLTNTKAAPKSSSSKAAAADGTSDATGGPSAAAVAAAASRQEAERLQVRTACLVFC